MSDPSEPVATAMPLIRWRGWRPLPLDLSSSEQGGQAFLVLEREGDLALLPTATLTYICYAPTRSDADRLDAGDGRMEVTFSAADARQTVLRTVGDLAGEGWQVVGRLHATFHGIDTEDDFWLRVDCAAGETQ